MVVPLKPQAQTPLMLPAMTEISFLTFATLFSPFLQSHGSTWVDELVFLIYTTGHVLVFSSTVAFCELHGI